MNKYILILISAALTSCALPAKKVTLTNKFYSAAAERALQPGNNTISGSALITQRGGGIVTCAGREVDLLPANPYSTERMLAIYDSSEKGFKSIAAGSQKIEFTETDPAYASNKRTTVCDAQGKFKFAKVTDGAYYLTTGIAWQINQYLTDGGILMRRVIVSGGEEIEVVLAP